jgi:ethanolamine utilization protein EutA
VTHHDHDHDLVEEPVYGRESAEPQTVHSPFTPDHDHDHDDAELPLEDNPIWQQDNVTLH